MVLEDRLGVDRDLDLVAHDHAALVEGRVPARAEVVAVDGGGGDESRADPGSLVDAAFPPRRRPTAEVVDVEHRRAGDSTDGEVSLHLEVRRPGPPGHAAAEGDLRMPFHVEEVSAAEVAVAIRLAGP